MDISRETLRSTDFSLFSFSFSLAFFPLVLMTFSSYAIFMKSSQVMTALAIIFGLGAIGVALHSANAGETRPTSPHGAHLSLANQGGSTVPPLLDYIPNYYQHVKPIL